MDSLHDDPALALLPPKQLTACVGLLALAESWARRWGTGGFVPRGQVERLGGTQQEATLLVSCGLWSKVVHELGAPLAGYQFAQWEEPSPPVAASLDSMSGINSVTRGAPLSPAERSRRYRQRDARRDGQRDGRHGERHGAVTVSVTERDGQRDGQRDASVTERDGQRDASVTESVTPVTVGGKGGSEISVSSPSPPGSERDLLAGCNAGAREEPPNPSRFRFELEELVRSEFFARNVTPQKAPASQWRDGCQTVADALQLGAYPDAREAMRAFAGALVDACAAGKPLGLALQQTPLGAQLKPVVAGGRKLSALALKAIAEQRGGT